MSPPKIIANRYVIDPKAPPRAGGMSTVHAALDLENGGRRVALKVFQGDALTLEDPVHRLAFERESTILQRLTHPHIVALIDWGRDEGTRFIVFEWIERTLFDLLAVQPVLGWDDFHERVGRPLLAALQYAFQHDIIHRDVKPQNVLVDESGSPKLADFSIAKYRARVQLGRTLSDHRTPFYSPPEYDDGRHSDSRDVFGFAALAVRCLTGVEFDSQVSFDAAVADLDVPDEIYECLQRALAKDPVERYANVLELAEDLEQVQRIRERAWVRRTPMYATLTKSVADIVGRDPLAGDSVERAVTAALNERSIIRVDSDTRSPAGASPEPVIKLMTPQWSFLAKVTARGGKDHLEFIHALPMPQWLWESEQEDGWCATYEFRLGRPPVGFDGVEAIRKLFEDYAVHKGQLESRRIEEQKNWLLRVWSNVLSAKEAVEVAQRLSVRFQAARAEGARLRVTTVGPVPEEGIGETWILKDAVGAVIVAELESVAAQEAVLWVDGELPDQVRGPGELVADTRAARAALQRQRAALDAVQYGRAVRADARELLLDPARCRPPDNSGDSLQLPPDLDEDKAAAVRGAFGTRDCLVVAGPPGTGKTRFIGETIAAILAHRPHCKILLAAQTHVAVDNALERVRASVPSVGALRVGKEEDSRIAPTVRDCLVSKLADQWARRTAERSKRYILEWAKRNGLDPAQVALGQGVRGLRLALEEERRCQAELQIAEGALGEIKGTAAVPAEPPDAGPGEPSPVEDVEEQDALDRIAETTRALRVAKKRVREARKALEKLPSGADLLDESPQSLSDWETLLLSQDAGSQRYVALLDLLEEWHARLSNAEDFHDALFAEAQVVAGTCIGLASARPLQVAEFDVCLVDEASKATVTEALVPLVRARSWVLVGDSKQLPPFVDVALQSPQLLARFDLREEDVRDTLLARFETNLPETCKAQLTYQRRMIAPIGALISECFYGGTLIHPPKDDLPILSAVVPAPVTWYTTAGEDGRDELVSHESFLNPIEAQLAVRVLLGLHAAAKLTKQRLAVGVITAYRAQRAELQRRCDPVLASMNHLDVEINTVDAFQGREVDVAIYSIVRANRANTLGFLREVRRLNVALSRGRFRLVIIGDHVFCRAAAGENPFLAVLQYMQGHGASCWLGAYRAN